MFHWICLLFTCILLILVGSELSLCIVITLCYSVEYCNLFFGVKLSIRLFCFILVSKLN